MFSGLNFDRTSGAKTPYKKPQLKTKKKHLKMNLKTTWDKDFQAGCLPQADVFKGNFQQECKDETGEKNPPIFTQVQKKPS